MIKLVFPGKPRMWRPPYVGSKGAFSKHTRYLNGLKILARKQYTGYPIECAINCIVRAFMPIPKGTSRAKRLLMLEGKIRPIRRPDRINIGKLYEDALNGTVILDDAQIVEGSVGKWYCENPRVEIFLSPVNDEVPL